MEKKKFPNEVWDPIRKSLRDFNDHVKKLPKRPRHKSWDADLRKQRSAEERKKRMNPRYNPVSGRFIDKRKRKNGGGDMPPRSDFIDRQVARDNAAGRVPSTKEE